MLFDRRGLGSRKSYTARIPPGGSLEAALWETRAWVGSDSLKSAATECVVAPTRSLADRPRVSQDPSEHLQDRIVLTTERQLADVLARDDQRGAEFIVGAAWAAPNRARARRPRAAVVTGSPAGAPPAGRGGRCLVPATAVFGAHRTAQRHSKGGGEELDTATRAAQRLGPT
jgi:hypothetical protein